jgi:CHAT domain-containing protein
MLAIIADPSDRTRLDVSGWEALLKEALVKPLDAGELTLDVVKHATRREIRDALLRQKPDIIQLVGHGSYANGKGQLALVDEDTGGTWAVDDEIFASIFLGALDRLGLICLAACQSASSDDPQAFAGVAPQLVQRGVPAVLAMQYEVDIASAAVFLEDFYAAIAARKPFDWATQSARNAVMQRFGLGNREFATPVLYMRAAEGGIF